LVPPVHRARKSATSAFVYCADPDHRAAGPYDIFVNIWQSNNYSSFHLDPAVDVGHARIFQMGYTGDAPFNPINPVGSTVINALSGLGRGELLTLGRAAPPLAPRVAT
jgi:hypothetical protein